MALILSLGCLVAAAGFKRNPSAPLSRTTTPPAFEIETKAPAMAARRVYIDSNGNKTTPPPSEIAAKATSKESRLIHFRDLPVRKSATPGGGEFVRFPGGFRINSVATKGPDGKIKITHAPGPRAARREPQS